MTHHVNKLPDLLIKLKPIFPMEWEDLYKYYSVKSPHISPLFVYTFTKAFHISFIYGHLFTEMFFEKCNF